MGLTVRRKKLLWSGYGMPEEVTELERYAALINIYTSRKLTNENDSLNATEGILRDFASTIDGQDNRFIYGLSSAAFDHALWSTTSMCLLCQNAVRGFLAGRGRVGPARLPTQVWETT
jgi:hypothetical protein